MGRERQMLVCPEFHGRWGHGRGRPSDSRRPLRVVLADAERGIEDMGDQAEEFVEDGGDLWLGGSVPKEAVDDLQRRLQDAVDGWLGDNGLQPTLFRVVEEAQC